MKTNDKLPKDYLCAALDGFDYFLNNYLYHSLKGRLSFYGNDISYCKIGMELFNASAGQFDVIETVASFVPNVFVDLKFLDIPETVQNVSRVIASKPGVSMFNVHATGGIHMMKAALKGAEETSQQLGIQRPKIIAVTILTSMDAKEGDVLKLALDTVKAGLDGIVCSALDLEEIKPELPEDFIFVTPGIRLPGGKADDQKRVATPDFAIKAGSSLLVVGRPIYEDKCLGDQARAVRKFNQLIEQSLLEN
jgi:orotidine-5'-phosphate decarboxylase